MRLTPELMIRAYSSGVFPMAETRTDQTFYWVDPPERGILPLESFHVPRSLRKVLRRQDFDIRLNSDFAATIAGCAAPTVIRPETWINEAILESFCQLHQLGLAHSVECWRHGRLVGGLYGLALGGAFFGESMFSRATNASRVALCHLAGMLRQGGFRLLDSQFITDHLQQFGAVEILRSDYRERLAHALAVTTARLPPPLGGEALLKVLCPAAASGPDD